MNLEYMKVSHFEMLQKNEMFHDILFFLDAHTHARTHARTHTHSPRLGVSSEI